MQPCWFIVSERRGEASVVGLAGTSFRSTFVPDTMTVAPQTSWPPTVGRYLLYGEIASGGMATVHFGRLQGAAGFARSVAIKRLHPQYARDPDFVEMFLDEAR